MFWQNGHTPLSLAEQVGRVAVCDVLRRVTQVSTTRNVQAATQNDAVDPPETMHDFVTSQDGETQNINVFIKYFNSFNTNISQAASYTLVDKYECDKIL